MKKISLIVSVLLFALHTESKVIEITGRSHLNDEIKASNAIIKFSAEWCGPCKKMKPIFHDISNQEEFKTIKFLAVDVDPHSDIADMYGVSGIPTLVLVKNGKEIERMGSSSLEGLKIALRRAFDLTAAVKETNVKKKIEETKESTQEPVPVAPAQEQKGIFNSIKRGFAAIKNAVSDGFNWIKRKLVG